MAILTIRNIPETVKQQLRIRAAEHGRSMEEEARQILREHLAGQRSQTAADIALELFGPKNGVELPEHPRVRPPPAPKFDSP